MRGTSDSRSSYIWRFCCREFASTAQHNPSPIRVMFDRAPGREPPCHHLLPFMNQPLPYDVLGAETSVMLRIESTPKRSGTESKESTLKRKFTRSDAEAIQPPCESIRRRFHRTGFHGDHSRQPRPQPVRRVYCRLPSSCECHRHPEHTFERPP